MLDPTSAIDVITILFVTLALLFAAVWLRDREPGLAWVALSYALGALWYGNSELLGAGPRIDSPVTRLGSFLIASAILTVTIGMARYLGPVGRGLRVLVVAMCLPVVLLLGALAVGVDLPRRLFQLSTMLPYVGVAVQAFVAQRREPAAGHALLSVVLISMPLTPIAMQFAGMSPDRLRHLVAIQPVLFGLFLLTVALLRRRRALQAEIARRAAAEQELRDANLQLEERVSHRTAHLQELIQALEAFNRNVSHDLRGPLGGIAQLSRLAREAVGAGHNEVAERWLAAISDQADASRELVGTLLDLARLGNEPMTRRRVSLASLVDEAFAEALVGRVEAGVGPPELLRGPLPDAWVDPAMLRRALVNLLGNAVKFSRQVAQPQILVAADVAGDDIMMRVSDNGVGFDVDAGDKLFQPFRRLHGAEFEGTGLGLTIVRQAIERHGGRVWAESRSGRGATFAFTLPGAATASAPLPDVLGALEAVEC